MLRYLATQDPEIQDLDAVIDASVHIVHTSYRSFDSDIIIMYSYRQVGLLTG